MASGKLACEYIPYGAKTFLRYFDKTNLETVDIIAPVRYFDDFLGKACDQTNDWTFAAVNSGAAAINVAQGGTVRITTGAADDDDADLALALVLKASQSIGIEARIANNDVAHTAFNVGFSDATGEAADLIACTFATASLTSTATDCALFFTDADATSNVIRAVAVKNNTDGTIVATSTTPADAEYHTYRVDIDSSGNVYFYLDGSYIGTEATGITTSVALCPYIGFINRETAANTLDIDYVRVWAGR